MIRPLFSRCLKAGIPAALAIFAVLAMYIVCIVYMFDPSTAQMLDELMAVMPELFDAFGMGHDTSTLTGFMLNYLYGFLLTLLPLVLVMLLVNKLLVKPVAGGELSYALASPRGRGAILGSIIGAVTCLLAVLLVACFACEIGCALVFFPDDLDVAALARVNSGLVCLWVLMFGICLLSAVTFARGPLALWTGGGVCLIAFLVQMVSQIGDGLEDAKYATFFTLFDPYGLADGAGEAFAHAGILLAAGIVLIAVAVAVFRRRDLAL